MIVEFLRRATIDLEEISDWIATDNPVRAESFADEIVERCLSLADNPARFPTAKNVAEFEIRKVSHGSYLIFYAIKQDRVEILRIVHGSRDWASMFGA